jgi:predicted CoA-binding protein
MSSDSVKVVAIDAGMPAPGVPDLALKAAYAVANALEAAGYKTVLVRPGRDAICERARAERARLADYVITISIVGPDLGALPGRD